MHQLFPQNCVVVDSSTHLTNSLAGLLWHIAIPDVTDGYDAHSLYAETTR